MSLIFQVIGALGLMGRIWLVQWKLADELEFRRHYVSRILSYYLFIAMMVEFESDIFNLAIMIPFPVVFVSLLGWDTLFFKKFKSRDYWEKNHFWLIVERLTLHLPIIAVQLWMLIEGPLNFVDKHNIIWEFIAVILLLYPTWFLWDKRWTDKDYLPDTRRNITIFIPLCTIGFFIYFMLV